MYGSAYNFTGVSFRENGHRQVPRRLVSVGIRAYGDVCQAGWQGNGVVCQCKALMHSGDQFVYWRFEEGEDDRAVRRVCVCVCV
jgi:hypothetical protein